MNVNVDFWSSKLAKIAVNDIWNKFGVTLIDDKMREHQVIWFSYIEHQPIVEFLSQNLQIQVEMGNLLLYHDNLLLNHDCQQQDFETFKNWMTEKHQTIFHHGSNNLSFCFHGYSMLVVVAISFRLCLFQGSILGIGL